MSLMQRQLAELLSAPPRKRPPPVAQEAAKAGSGQEAAPSLAVLLSMLRSPEISGATANETTAAPAPAAEAPTAKAAAVGELDGGKAIAVKESPTAAPAIPPAPPP